MRSLSPRLVAIAACSVLALCLDAGTLQAQNLLANPSFDADTAGWQLGAGGPASGSIGWSAFDSGSLPSSGSIEITNTRDEAISFTTAEQCVPVTGDTEYTYSLEVFVPAGQAPPADAAYGVIFYAGADCGGPFLGTSPRKPNVSTTDTWITKTVESFTSPSEARTARVYFGVRKVQDLSGSVIARFDDVYFGPPGGEGGGSGGGGGGGGADVPDPDPAGWFTDPAFPGFRFNVEIGTEPTTRLGTRESFCLDETVCVSGAVPGRVELLLRIVGPKPNGYLWPTLFKASTARFQVWIEQLGTGKVQYYVLDGASPGSSELPGLFDREGFLP